MAELENGRVVGVLLQLLSPRYRSSTHREALWTLVLLAEEEKARKACRDNRCFPKLFKLLGSRSEPTVEAACQLLARLAYDEQCAEMMVAAGGVPLLAPMTSYPNFKIRDLAQDATQALEEFASSFDDWIVHAMAVKSEQIWKRPTPPRSWRKGTNPS